MLKIIEHTLTTLAWAAAFVFLVYLCIIFIYTIVVYHSMIYLLYIIIPLLFLYIMMYGVIKEKRVYIAKMIEEAHS